MPDETNADVTIDTLLRGRVTLLQPARGFRSSLDPVLLAGFLTPPHGRFLDIGCGTGALSFLLLATDPAASGVAVELQPRLARLAAISCLRNDWGTRLDIHQGDVRQVTQRFAPASFDLVATNPPFRRPEAGPLPPDRERALAVAEVSLTLPGWLDVAARAVRPGGRVAAIFAADRLAELVAAMHARSLAPARLRRVHAYTGRPPARVLVEAIRDGQRPLTIEPPLIVHSGGSERFSEEVRRMLGED
jgi:tRNA1Val (adenine37-N6)-methyltransferase